MDAILYFIFMTCAIVGSTVVVLQFAMSLLGFAGHSFADGIDLAHDIPHDMPHDLPHDLGHHLPHDVSHDFSHFGPTWLFSMISLRTIVAFLAFFGIGGLGALGSNVSAVPAVLIAITFGVTAFVLVGLMMLGMRQLKEDGTIRIEGAIGQAARVYLTIPAAGAGIGKVHIRWQGRISEYPARTNEPQPLEVGAMVSVTRICEGRILEVAAVREPQAADAKSPKSIPA